MPFYQQDFVHAMLNCICYKSLIRGACLLQAISMVFFTNSWRPDSFYTRIAANRQRGLHTLCLLDIKVKEPSLESLARGRTVRITLSQCGLLQFCMTYCVHAGRWIKLECLPQISQRWPLCAHYFPQCATFSNTIWGVPAGMCLQ